MNQDQEQRHYPRRATFIVAKYTVLEGTFQDIIDSIGAGGLFIKTKRKIAVGQPITTKFPLFKLDNKLQVSGRVVRRDSDGFAVTFSEPIRGLICKEGHFPQIFHEDDR
jgi:hypothetical protein